ncbi:MAG: hypothetical protein V7K47_17010 [Nostoc sp.]
MTVSVVSASGSEERASGGLLNPKGLGVSPMSNCRQVALKSQKADFISFWVILNG